MENVICQCFRAIVQDFSESFQKKSAKIYYSDNKLLFMVSQRACIPFQSTSLTKATPSFFLPFICDITKGIGTSTRESTKPTKVGCCETNLFIYLASTLQVQQGIYLNKIKIHIFPEVGKTKGSKCCSLQISTILGMINCVMQLQRDKKEKISWIWVL